MLTMRTEIELRKPFLDTSNKHLCPECCTVMTEVEQITENSISFIWYECTRDGCSGQWLEKKTA